MGLNPKCKGKVSYTDKKSAAAVAKEYRAGREAYYCKYCDLWHVGRRRKKGIKIRCVFK